MNLDITFERVRHVKKRILNLLFAVLFTGLPLLNIEHASAAVDVCTWTGGGGDANWSTATNWSCATDGVAVPGGGDSLVFPDLAAQLSNTNDLVGLTVDNILVSGMGYTLGGNDVTITPASSTALQLSADSTTVDFNFTISAGASKAITNSGTGNVINGDVALSLGTNDMNINTSTGSDVVFNGVISGSLGTFLLNDNDGLVEFAGLNTFTTSGYMNMQNDSVLECSGASGCLGNSSNLLYFFGTSELILSGGTDFANNFIVDSASTTPSLSIVGNGVNYSGDMTVNRSLIVNIASGSTDGILSGDITIAAGMNLDVRGAGNYTASALSQNGGVVSGDGDILIQNSGFDLFGPNTSFNGDVYVNAEALLNVLDQGLGTTTGATYVADGGVLRSAIGSLDTISDNITLAGDGNNTGFYNVASYYNEGADVVLTGDVTLSGPTTMLIRNLSGNSVTLSGKLTGTGDLTLSNSGVAAGDYTMNGTAVNDYVGTLSLDHVSLNVAKTGGLGITGDIDAVATSADSAILTFANTVGDLMADSGIVNLINDVGNDAIFGSSKPAEVIGAIIGDGNFYVTGAGQGVTVGGSNVSATFGGVFTNTTPSVITKIGSGTWNIGGATYGGVAGQGPTIDVQAGSVNWGGAALGELNTIVSSGGTLKGTGTTGAVTVNSGGAINVGNSPGCLTVASLTLGSGSVFAEEITGTTACSDYDQTTVTGTATLTDATLTVLPTGTPSVGSVYTIITAGSVVGTFSGLANGTSLTVGNIRYQINYTATAVTLTVAEIVASTTNTVNSTAASSGALANTGIAALLSAGTGSMLLSVVALLARRRED